MTAPTTEVMGAVNVYSQLVNNQIADEIVARRRDNLPVNIVIADYFNFSNPSIVDTMISLNRQLVSRQP